MNAPVGFDAATQRPAWEVADVIRARGEAFLATHCLSAEQRRVLYDLADCRTAALGGHVQRCLEFLSWDGSIPRFYAACSAPQAAGCGSESLHGGARRIESLTLSLQTRRRMNPSYFRIRLPLPQAKTRLREWWGVEEPSEFIETNSLDAVDLAITPDGPWRGGAVFFYENDGWSVFEDLSGGFGSTPASAWQKFAQQDDFVFAGYNDAIPYGELIVIEKGVVLRDFMACPAEPEVNKNDGQLSFEKDDPITSWSEVASFVDEDSLAFSEKGWLWVNEKR